MKTDIATRLRSLSEPGTSFDDVGGRSILSDAADEIDRLIDLVGWAGKNWQETHSDLTKATRWIPVEERLPVDGQQVLMAYRFPDDNTCATWPHIVQEVRMSTADFLNGDFTEVDDAVRYTRQSVSHWMPLPEPPEGK